MPRASNLRLIKRREDDVMTHQEDFQRLERLFRAFEKFRLAMDAVMEDLTLLQRPCDELTAIRKAGQALHDVGGVSAMLAAAYSYQDSSEQNTYAVTLMNQPWSGIGRWLA